MHATKPNDSIEAYAAKDNPSVREVNAAVPNLCNQDTVEVTAQLDDARRASISYCGQVATVVHNEHDGPIIIMKGGLQITFNRRWFGSSAIVTVMSFANNLTLVKDKTVRSIRVMVTRGDECRCLDTRGAEE